MEWKQNGTCKVALLLVLFRLNHIMYVRFNNNKKLYLYWLYLFEIIFFNIVVIFATLYSLFFLFILFPWCSMSLHTATFHCCDFSNIYLCFTWKQYKIYFSPHSKHVVWIIYFCWNRNDWNCMKSTQKEKYW